MCANMINGFRATGEGHFNSRDRTKKIVISVIIHKYFEQWLAMTGYRRIRFRRIHVCQVGRYVTGYP